MDFKKRIINNHLFFRRITQEGGYYMNSVMNQSVLTDLPNFYNEFEEKINKLINQLNTNGKKVSEKSKENINKFLNELKRKEQQLETLSLSLNSISLDKNFTNRIITMDDVMRYADNLKGHQLKGYDIVESLKKYVIDSEKKLEPLTTEPLTTKPSTTESLLTEPLSTAKKLNIKEVDSVVKASTSSKPIPKALSKESKEVKSGPTLHRQPDVIGSIQIAEKKKQNEVNKLTGIDLVEERIEENLGSRAIDSRKQIEVQKKEEKVQEEDEKAPEEQELIPTDLLESANFKPVTEDYTKDDVDANILATPESDLKKVNEKVNEINILDELLSYLNEVKEISNIEVREILKGDEGEEKSHNEIIDEFLKLLMNFNSLNKNDKNDIDLSEFIEQAKKKNYLIEEIKKN